MPEYGDIEAVKNMLKHSQLTTFSEDADESLTAIQKAVSRALEYELGRTFGAPAGDETVILYAGIGDTLLLPRPARAITTVSVGGNVAGGVVTGGTLFPSDRWEHYPVGQDGLIYGIRLIGGGWWGYDDPSGNPRVPVVILADFANTDADAEVPDDVTYAVNYLIAERYKLEQASPAGFTGPDGATVPIRNAFKDPFVTMTLERYRAKPGYPVF
jgi:hypothetical protein